MGACLAYGVLIGGCHIAFGLDDLTVAFSIDDACEALCETDQAAKCSGRMCIAEVCRAALLYDPFPWCQEPLLAYSECLTEQPQGEFSCGANGFLELNSSACAQQEGAFRECLAGDFPNSPDDCNASCYGVMEDVCVVPPGSCYETCMGYASDGLTCGGLWAGLARCAALHSDAEWTCEIWQETPYAAPKGYGHACTVVYA
ncbi:MAG: hypothetical protein JRI68_30750, partial [Deltaproteobacteria bacterium]|nr:hypothetical protein [Deltaproteobacteria bacterium]